MGTTGRGHPAYRRRVESPDRPSGEFAPGRELAPRIIGRTILLGCAGVGLASLVLVLVLLPEGTPVSADPGAPVVPTWVTVLPAVVGIGLALVLPPRPPALPVVARHPRRLSIRVGVLVGLAILFPAVGVLARPGPEAYLLVKVLLLVLVPTVLLLVVRGAVRIEAGPAGWRWWAPLAVVLVWTLLSQVAPWNPRYDPGDIDPLTLIGTSVAVGLSAGVGEELFYRRWLQTHLEARFGPWPGIALTALLFACMHLGSHGTGDVVLDVARVVVNQGSFGLLMGVLWWRHRNLALIILAHLIVNGWGVVAHLLTVT